MIWMGREIHETSIHAVDFGERFSVLWLLAFYMGRSGTLDFSQTVLGLGLIIGGGGGRKPCHGMFGETFLPDFPIFFGNHFQTIQVMLFDFFHAQFMHFFFGKVDFRPKFKLVVMFSLKKMQKAI